MKTKRFLVKLRTFIRNHEKGVCNILASMCILAFICASLLIIDACQKAINDDKVDITYIDHNTIMPHDTSMFKTSQEEYNFLVEANTFKRELADEALEAIEIVESIMEDGLDSDIKYSLDDLEEALETNGYYEHINKIDSLLNTQM